MSTNKYKYALIDLSYLLTRNIYAISKGKSNESGEWNEGDVIKATIYTINKVARDFGITADKFIMLYDKWDPIIGGYYRSWLLKDSVSYKGSRVYINEDYINSLKANPDVSEEELKRALEEFKVNQIKLKTKKGMINDFKTIGIPCLGVEGWEFDDLAWLSACILHEIEPKKCVIITKDSDLQYSLTPKMDYFKLPTGGSSPEVITYDQMYEKIPQKLVDKGISLYDYKSYMDSLGAGHNDMRKTIKPRKNLVETILKILDGNFENVKDPEVFKLQMSTFDLTNYPKLSTAKELISEFDKVGKIGDLAVFHDFCNKYQMTISDKYYDEFTSRLDPTLYVK